MDFKTSACLIMIEPGQFDDAIEDHPRNTGKTAEDFNDEVMCRRFQCLFWSTGN